MSSSACRRSVRFFAVCRAVGLLAVAATLVAARPAAADDEAARRPNFVVFLADDLGWGDLGCYGHPTIRTPNLDAFARQGVRLTQCYSASAVCSPSRSAIVTGRTPFRNGVYNWIPEGRPMHLRTSELTFAKLLQGPYATCHVGKWHLNGMFNDSRQPQPGDHGYDWWMATQNNAAPSHMNPKNFVRNGQPVGPLEGFSAPLVVDEAVAWLKQHRDPNKPFALCVWTHEPHLPIESDPKFMSLYADLPPDVQQHHGNVSQLDFAFGRLMRTLDELKLADDTFVIFTSDNGPEGAGDNGRTRGSTGGLRGRKRDVYEGGIRVPGIVRWPGKAKAGGESATPVIGSDIFATVCDLAGVAAPTDRVLDGGSLRPLFADQPVRRARPLFWRCPLARSPMKMALREGDWKIVADESLTTFELFDLAKDQRETTDLAAAEPARLAELQQSLRKLVAELDAEGPKWPEEPAAPKNPKKAKKAKN